MRVVSSGTPSPLFPLPQDSQSQLVSDLLNMLIGVASTSFPLNQVGVTVNNLSKGNHKVFQQKVLRKLNSFLSKVLDQCICGPIMNEP